MQLHGRTAVVTGAADGIGLAMARRFVTEGMRVVLVDIDEDRVRGVATGLEQAGGTVHAVGTDVADRMAVERLADEAVERFGDVHLLCNNAGVIRAGSSWTQDLNDWAAVMDVNLMGVVHGMRAFVPAMLSHESECHVVNTASVGGLLPAPGLASYSATKYAVVGLTETFAAELEELGATQVGVSILCPGGVATGFWAAEQARRRSAQATHRDPIARARFEAAARTDRDDQTTPVAIADLVVQAVRQRRFWIVPVQPALVEVLRSRSAAIDQAVQDDSLVYAGGEGV